MDDNELSATFKQELPIITRMINGYIASNPVLAQLNMKLDSLQLVTEPEQKIFELMAANKEEDNNFMMFPLDDDPPCKICVNDITGQKKCVTGNVCPPGFH